MILIILSLHTLASGYLSCDEKNYETLVLEPTNPFYKEQFHMNQNDFTKSTDALGFGFWSQYRPYQEILINYQVDYAFQANKTINGDLLFSIRNVDTNKFETTYFLYYPLMSDLIYQKLAQDNGGYFSTVLLRTDTYRFEGLWIYTQLQFIPLKSQLQVYFATYQSMRSATLDFKLNQYGNKEIIIGGSGKVQFLCKSSFHGRMSRPVNLRIEQLFMNQNEFFTLYYSCNAPKSCSGPIKMDIIKDELYMNSTMYLTRTVKLYENAYSFGGWVKVDVSNINTVSILPLIRATINKNYRQSYQLGDRSFRFLYVIDLFTNISFTTVQTYSYIIPQQGTIQKFGQNSQKQFMKSNMTDFIQQWHFIRFTYGNRTIQQNYFSQAQNIRDFPISLKKMTLIYEVINSQANTCIYKLEPINILWVLNFKVGLRNFKFGHVQTILLLLLKYVFIQQSLACHFTCLPTQWCLPEKKCEQCPINTYRSFLQITQSCECEVGYYTVQNQPKCENFLDNFKYLRFNTSKTIQSDQCYLGYYQYQNKCYECPQKISDRNQISCLECIYNKTSWYLYPVCETDYVKLIDQVDEPFYQSSRPINYIDLFKINIFAQLELCQGCYQYCNNQSSGCFLSNYFHQGNQMIVQCKRNYYFDQIRLECNKCQNNCEICDSEGKCLQCTNQHYFDPLLQNCLQCDIRCEECQYDQQFNQQVCISCPEYFTLYNGKCLKCGVYCKFCSADHYLNTGEVYARCYQCIENMKYFVSFDAINCHINPIQNCLYAFQYYEADRHVQTIDMMFQPMTLNQSIITACAKCIIQYSYIISERICMATSLFNSEYCIQENRSSATIVLSEVTVIYENVTRIQTKDFTNYTISNCEAFLYSKTDVLTKCVLCSIGFFRQRLIGNCLKCPAELNCQVCDQQQKLNKDHFKLEFKAFYEWFVNFDGLHNFEDFAQSSYEEDFEIVCTACHFGYQLFDGHCVKSCPENCAECIQSNGQLQCLRCFDTIQGTIQTLVNNECIQCPFNCAVCLPQDSFKVYQYNPYFNNTQYSYFTNLCLRLIKELPDNNYYYDPEIGNYIECGEQQQCYQEVHFQMAVHCNDQSFEQLLQSSPNKVEFRQQNIKLSQLFSTSTETYIPQYENDIVYMRFNEKSIKKINQTYIFTNSISKCVISEDSKLQNSFSENVYSIKETIINFIGIDDNVKIYINSQLYIDGFTQVLFKNIELILTTTNFDQQITVVNSIIISHLISVEITFERINFTSQSHNSTINLSIFNSSSVKINTCRVSNLIFIRNNFINIQNPLWQFIGLDHNDIMNVNIVNFSLLNCTFINSSIIHNVLDNKFVFSFMRILIQAEFFNSFFITQFQTFQFSNKIIIFDSISIQSKIIDTDGFLNLEYIDGITVNLLTYNNSIISNSILIKSNNEFSFNQLNFNNLQMIGNSILLKYIASVVNNVNNIVISTLNIFNVSYEQINPFIYFINQGIQNQLQITSLSLEANYLAKQLQKSKLEIFYYSALIYVEMQNIFIANTNILRMPGYQEFALVNTWNITFLNLMIAQLEPIKGLHQYLDCQQQQNYGNQYFSVISIFLAKYTLFDNIQAQKLILYNFPLIKYQSVDLSQKLQSEIFEITSSLFYSNMILVTQDIKSSSIIMIQSEQLIEIEINNITFRQNQLNIYSKGNSVHSCLMNIQCFSCIINLSQLLVIDNLVTNDTNPLFYMNVKSLKLKNSQFLKNNIFEYNKIKGNLMWSFPNNISSITTESLQIQFPIMSDGLFTIYFEALFIENIIIREAQGCKGGAFQLYSKQSGIIKITNSHFIQIRASLNCDQSFGGALYIDSTKSKLMAQISQIYIDNVMSLNLGGFIYVLSAANELNITISNVIAKSYQSLKGSFIYASYQYKQSVVQEIHIYNCSLTNKFSDLIEYLGYLSTFKNLDTSNLLKDRVQFYFMNGQLSMKQIIINTLNYESFIYVSGCIQMDFSQLYFGGGNYSNSPLFSIQIDPLQNQKLNFYDVKIQNFDFSEDINKSNNTQCKNKYEFNITKLTLLCQQSLYYNLPVSLQSIFTQDFLYSRGLCYLEDAFSNLIWGQFSLIKFSSISTYHRIKMNQIAFQNNICNKCKNGLLNIEFEQGLNNLVQIVDLKIINSTCGTLGCLVLNQGQLDQSTLLYRNSRLLNLLEKDYYNMNFTLKIYRYTCLGNTANFGVCLFIHNIKLQIIDSIFSNNNAISSGGAVYSTNTEEQLSLIRTIMENNRAKLGDNVVYQNQILSNLTQTQSYSNYSKYQINQLVGIPSQIKITKLNHLYYQPNVIQSQNNKYQLDLSVLDRSFLFPNGQSIASYQYFDLKSEQYVQLNLSLRLIAMNNLDQEQIEIQGTKCDIYSRMIQNLEDNVEFTQNYINYKSIEFNITTKDYNLDDLILNFDSDLQDTMFLQLQFACNSIKIPIYLENDPYNIIDWHDQYFLRTSLIKPLPCQIGEIKQIDTHVCRLCDSNSGFYSVKFNSKKCSPKNDLTMISVTSAQIYLKQYYWRPYITSDFIENCFNLQSNCVGSWKNGDQSCFIGHIGALCEQCDLYNIRGNGQYSISSTYTCGSCSTINQNMLIIGLITTFTLISIIISVKSTDGLITDLHQWKRNIATGILIANEKAQPGILIKILTNYLQIVGSLSTFKMEMPSWISSVIIASSDPIQSMAYSLDCFLIEMFQIPILYGRIIWHFIMLIAYILAALILFYLMNIKSKESFRLGIISTIIIYTFIFLQPNIIKSLISSISYRTISGFRWVQGHVAYRYDSDLHQTWLPYLLSLLISVVILIPAYFLNKLFQIKENLNILKNRSIWGILYNEYKKSAYYWEIVKIFLKVVIIIILTYYEDFIFVKAALINLFIQLYMHYLHMLQPYNLKYLNKLEALSAQTCSISMIFGLIIYSSQLQHIYEVQYPLFLILFICNARFLRNIFLYILIAYLNKFHIQIDELKEKIKQRFPKLQEKIPYCVKLLENRTKKKYLICSKFRRIVRQIVKNNKAQQQ